MKKPAIEPSDTQELVTVEDWRKRASKAFERFEPLTQTKIAEELASRDSYFEGLVGFRRLDNVKRGLAGLETTARAVLLMEQLRPEEPKDRLARQGLKRAH